MIIVLMGVAGAGKTLIGQRLARELQWPFLDADNYHSPGNVQKMASGVPLTDADREAWLAALRQAIANINNAVLACSALREDFRRRLAEGHDVRFVYLRATPSLIAHRLESRTGHYFKSDLLHSQFDALEEPEDALVIDASAPPDAIVAEIRARYREDRRRPE